jgi:dynein heavy chain
LSWKLLHLLFSSSLYSTQDREKLYYLERNPNKLCVLLSKLYVFAYTWSFGGNFKRVDELEDDAGIGRKGGDRRDFIKLDLATEFDQFVREMFEIEPPLGTYF